MEKLEFEKNLLDFTEIEWFVPTPRKPEAMITITSEKCFNFNQSLRIQMPERITIGVHQDGKEIYIKEASENGYRVPKSGTIKVSDIIAGIKSRGIKLPVRYLVTQVEDIWIATLIPVSTTLPIKTPKKPRKNGLKAMLQKGDEQ